MPEVSNAVPSGDSKRRLEIIGQYARSEGFQTETFRKKMNEARFEIKDPDASWWMAAGGR